MRRFNQILDQVDTEKERNEGYPFILELIDIITPESKGIAPDLSQICLVTEYFNSDLDQLLKHPINFSAQHMLKVLYGTLCSLSFIHLTNVIHRDVKPANILISQDCSVKVCDFGLSRSLPNRCKYNKYEKFEDQP